MCGYNLGEYASRWFKSIMRFKTKAVNGVMGSTPTLGWEVLRYNGT